MDARRGAWLAAALLLTAALVLVLSPWRPFRESVELGAAIGALALSVGAAGIALALTARRGRARVLVAVAAGLSVILVGWVALVFATVPDFDASRTIEYTRLPDDTNATSLDAAVVPAALRADLLKLNVTDHSWTTVPMPEATRLWEAAASRTGYQVDGHRGYVLRVEGRVYDFAYGPMV